MPETSWVQSLAQALAVYGVYALIPVFLYLWRRSSQNFKEAADSGDKKHFGRVHTATVGAIFGCSTVVIVIQAINLFTKPASCMIGFVQNLAQDPAPQVVGDHQIVDEMFPDDPQVEFFERSVLERRTGRKTVRWVIVPRSDVRAIPFVLQSTRATLRRPVVWSLTEQVTDPELIEEPPISKRFTLYLDSIDYADGSPINLRYHPPADTIHPQIGTLGAVRRDGTEWLLPETSDSVASEAGANLEDIGMLHIPSLLVSTLHAQEYRQTGVFSRDGSYAARAGRTLRLQLGNRDLATHRAARDLLISSGTQSLRFIEDAIDRLIGDSLEAVESRAVYLHNLAEALKAIERNQASPMPELHRALAAAFYRLGDYHNAAMSYDRAGPVGGDDEYFYRGITYYEDNRYQDAIDNLEAYLPKATTPYAKMATRNMLGISYLPLKNRAEVLRHLRGALAVSPNNPYVLNNLAYAYAEFDIRLTEALSMAERALAQEPDNPNWLDTKGWVLFKLEQFDDALTYLERAAELAPYDEEIRAHLDTLREFMPQR